MLLQRTMCVYTGPPRFGRAGWGPAVAAPRPALGERRGGRSARGPAPPRRRAQHTGNAQTRVCAICATQGQTGIRAWPRIPLLGPHSRPLPGGPAGVSARPAGSRPGLGAWPRGGAGAGSAIPTGSARTVPGRRMVPWTRSGWGGSSPTRTRGVPARNPPTRDPGGVSGSPATPISTPPPPPPPRHWPERESARQESGALGQARHAGARAPYSAGKSYLGGGGCQSFWDPFHSRFHNPAVPPTEGDRREGEGAPTTPDYRPRRSSGGLEL